MDSNFLKYLEQLELIAFFSGYPLIFSIVVSWAASKKSEGGFRKKAGSVLPFSYALVGTLFLGLQLRNLYPDYSLINIGQKIHLPYLKIWALSSMFFWVPALGKRVWICLLHSLIFFFLILRDFYSQFAGLTTDRNILQNDMKLYADSLLLNGAAFAIVALICYFFLKQRAK